MEKYPIIQDFAHLCVKMDDELKPVHYRGIENQFGNINPNRKWMDGVLVREGCNIPDRPKTPYEQRWDNLSDFQKMQLKGLLEHYSNEYQMEANG